MSDPEWIVNDLGELGVMVDGCAHFLYKGESMTYTNGRHDDGTPVLYRPVGKREFGECAHPIWGFWVTDSEGFIREPSKPWTEGPGWKPVPVDHDAVRVELLDLLGSMADGWPHEGDVGAMQALADILGVKLVEKSDRMRMDPTTLPEGYVDPYVDVGKP